MAIKYTYTDNSTTWYCDTVALDPTRGFMRVYTTFQNYTDALAFRDRFKMPNLAVITLASLNVGCVRVH